VGTRVIPYAPYVYQADFHADKARWKIVVGGRRVGKSKMCIQECIKACLSKPKQLVYWIAPSYKVAKEVGFEEFNNMIDVLQPVIDEINLSNLTIKFKNNSQLVFKSGDNPDSLRGRKINFCILDEAAFIKPEIWQVIRPALADTKGSAVLISTPNGIGDWFHTIWQLDTWSKYHWPSTLNTIVMTEEELADIKANMSQTEFDQEIMAKFVTKAGRVYNDFDDNNIVEDFIPGLDKYDIHLGLDFGFAAPSAICFMAVNRLTEEVIQFDEIYINRTQMTDIINLIIDRLKEYNYSVSDLKMNYCDPAGEAYELSSGASPVDMMRAAGFQIKNKASKIAPGIAQVRSYIRNCDGVRRFKVCKKCKETIRSHTGYQYDTNANGTSKEEALKDGLHDHMCDSVRYFFVNRFDTAKYVAKDVEQVSYLADKRVKVFKRCGVCHKPFMSSTPKDKPPFVCEACK
jgi:PBSX family phage terminase large subunit